MKGSSLSDSSSSSRSSADSPERKKKKKKVKKVEKKKKERKELKKLEQQERIREGKELGDRRRKSMAIAATNPFESALNVPQAQMAPPLPGCIRVDFGFLDKHLGLDLELNGRKGAVVRKVVAASLAEKKGITKSCIIQALNGQKLPTSTKLLEETMSKRPLVVDFLPAPKEDKKQKKEKKTLLKAEAKRREELQNQDASLQNGQQEGSSLAGRATKAESENAKGASLHNGQQQLCSENDKASSSKADEKTDSSERKDSPHCKRQRTMPSEKEMRRLANFLMESEPGSSPSNEPIALRFMTKQQCVAWQWRNSKGVMQYPIPIGSNKPLSPFSDSDL